MATEPFAYIRRYYNVPAEFGRRVTVEGKPGIIIRDRGCYIGVNFDDDNPGNDLPCHPTWKVEYLGIDTPRPWSKSKQRYSDYLDVADCFDSFKDYLTHLTNERKAAKR